MEHGQIAGCISFQEIIFKLKHYWAERGCIIQEPYDVEVGAGTMCPETFLRVLGPEALPRRLRAAQPPSRRRPLRRESEPPVQAPAAAGDPEAVARRRHRPVPGSLEAIGIDLRKHDIKFEEDNWESPTLGAWGIGWQVMLDGLEITQFTYFQQCGGIDLDLVPAELTYGLERLAAFLQVRRQRLRHRVDPGRQVRATCASPTSCSIRSTTSRWPTSTACGSCSTCTRARRSACSQLYAEVCRTSSASRCLPTYDQVLKCSNLFNLLDARGAI